MVIEYTVDLSLTESLIPPIIHVKQFDHTVRCIRCRLYQGAVAFIVPNDVIVTCFGTRPDGRVFQYGSDITPEIVYADNGTAVIVITDYMTEVFGRFPVDVSLIAANGSVLSTFSMVFKVEASAVSRGRLTALTYEKCLQDTIGNISGCFITEDGYFGIYSDNGLNLPPGSFSPALLKVETVIEERLMETTLNADGIAVYTTSDEFGLEVSVDDDGRMVVLFGESTNSI